MKKYKILKNQKLEGNVIIGFFDCFHKGHMKLLKNKNASIITFKNTPTKNHNILNFHEKMNFFTHLGFKDIYVFDIKNHNMLAQKFYDRYLINVSQIIVGEDCKIGSDLKLIQSLALQPKQLQLIKKDNQFSSTKIKKLLTSGQVEEVNQLLYEKYNIIARVKTGNKKGRIIGYRTANFYFKKYIPILEKGIYISQTIYQEKVYKSVTFWGVSKTVKNNNEAVMETHIIDFKQNIYFKKIKVIILKKIGDIQKYDNINDLHDAIQKYIFASQTYISS